MRAVYFLARRWCDGDGLDLGATAGTTDARAGFPGAIPVDLALPGTGSASDLSQYRDKDFIFSSHTLEHVDDPELVVRECYRALRTGGHLFLYLPFPGYPDLDPALNEQVRSVHKWQPDPLAVGRLLVLGGFDVVYAEWTSDHRQSFATVGVRR